MKVLLTGGTGSVGRAVASRMVEKGHDLTVIGRRDGLEVSGADYRSCDVGDFRKLLLTMGGMEAVIHLAAIPTPLRGYDPVDIWNANATGTYHVYEAASRLGIRRVVTASSINAFGFNFGLVPFSIRRIPIDETHPTHTTDPYSFSKEITERVGDYYWRRSEISGACLRLPWVYDLAKVGKEVFTNAFEPCRRQAAELTALPDTERRSKIDSMVKRFDEFRRSRYEPGAEQRYPHGEAEPLMPRRSTMWTAVDCRDSAQAFEKAVTADYKGSHALFVNDSHNVVGVPSAQLARLFYPEAEAQLQSTETLISIDRARRLLGYEPEFSVRRFYHPTPAARG
jgi:nucleoside-diphosphate-sugar epimerase